MNSVTRVKHHTFTGKKKALALGIALTLSTAAQATQLSCYTFTSVAGGNFSMLSPQGSGATGTNPNFNPNLTSGPNSDPYIRGGAGYVFGGTNNVTFTWDGTLFNSSSDYTGITSVSNATISSPTTFFGAAWTAHHVQIFGPGTYTFDTTTYNGGANSETGMMTMTVGAGQIGAHMLFDWNGNFGIDVVNVWNLKTTFSNCGASAPDPVNGINCLWTGATNTVGNTASTIFTFASTDDDGDGTLGIPMAALGPFAGNNANFNLKGTFTGAGPGDPGDPCPAPASPNPFTFTDVTKANPGTLYTSNTITVTGLISGVNAPISVVGGEYSVNGGTYTTVAGTVTNNDMVTVRQTSAATEDGARTDTILTIGTVSDTYSVTVIDKKPDAFFFTSQTGVPVSTPVESNTITVGGMDAVDSLGAVVTAPISISAGGEYSLNGGTTWSSTAGTQVANGATIKVRQMSAATAATTTIITLTLGSVSNGTQVTGNFSVRTAGGLRTTGNNFTMIDPSGGAFGGTNDVVMTWDQQFNASTSDPVTPATAHMTLSSGTPFFSYRWTAHHIRVFGPSMTPYVINTDCTTAQIEAGTCTPNADPSKNYSFTVGPNQIAAHMLFDWNTTKNIDVVDVWDQGAVFGPSPLFTGQSGCANPAQVWDLMSTDWDGDGKNSAKMIDGPFKDFSANFNVLTTTAHLACAAYTPTVNVADPSNAPGCSISPTPVSALKRGDWWLVAGFLAWLGAIRIRSRRKTQS